jgi:hypothetical protein
MSPGVMLDGFYHGAGRAWWFPIAMHRTGINGMAENLATGGEPFARTAPLI